MRAVAVLILLAGLARAEDAPHLAKTMPPAGKVSVEEAIKSVGSHEISIKLYRGITAKVKLKVESEGGIALPVPEAGTDRFDDGRPNEHEGVAEGGED